MNTGTAVPMRKLSRHFRKGTIARAAVVVERDREGNVCRRTLDVRDVEEKIPDAKEIIVVDAEMGEKILIKLTRYNNTLRFVGVMATVAAITSVIELFT